MSKTSENSTNVIYFKKPYQKYNNNPKPYYKYNENEIFNKIIQSPKNYENKKNFKSNYKVYLKEENYYKSYKNYNKFSNKKIRKLSSDSANDSTSNEDYNEIISPNNNLNNVNLNNNNNQNKNQIKTKTIFKSKADDFKIKYKTELCKYYEINGFCKFGDSVRINI